MQNNVYIIGAGLAGCECAWLLAEQGISVVLFEMKPHKFSPAHSEETFAELVCSNSFRSSDTISAVGILKEELSSLNSLIMQKAMETAVPAGKALAVDRTLFSKAVTDAIMGHKNITVVRKEIVSLNEEDFSDAKAVVISAGPLVSEALAKDLGEILGETELYFYDAIAPIISTDSIDTSKTFWASRYEPERKEYLNCPLTEEEYKSFVQALVDGEKVIPKEFEKEIHFEGCLPVEVMAERGEKTLSFGPLKPVGFINPHTNAQPHAVVQLRPENKEKTALNMVGFQTKLTYPEQKRIFSQIPGLENAEFLRLGSIHRNTFVNAPKVLDNLELKNRRGVYLAGQITGVEGYVESVACGLYLGLILASKILEKPFVDAPIESAIGALMGHLRAEAKKFQPSNVHFGLSPALNQKAGKLKRKELYASRAKERFQTWKESLTL